MTNKGIKFTFAVILVLISIVSFGQTIQTDTLPLYLRFPTVPPFTITKVPDSTKFTKADLGKRKATLMVIFSPDCDHCQHTVKELKKHISLFKKIQIVMVSPVEYQYIQKFYDEYKLGEYTNILVGWDPTFMLGTFYKLKSYPGLFLYDKKGKFIQTFDRDVPVQTIAEAL